MRIVSLLIAATILSFSASAQTSGASGKRTAVNVQQKTKKQKVKPAALKVAAAKDANATTLTDEKAHKAKWTFEEMLKRRLEIDAEDAKRVTQQQNK